MSKPANTPRRAAALVVLANQHAAFMPRTGVPASRAECKDGARPCVYVRCVWHLALVIGADRQGRRGGKWGAGAGSTLVPDWMRTAPTEDPAQYTKVELPLSCALDFAEKHEAAGTEPTVEELGEAIHTKPTRTWMVVKEAIRKLKAGSAEPLEEFDEP